MDTLQSWLNENKWLTLSDHFWGHKKVKNDLHTLTGLCAEIDTVWDEIFHNQDMMEEYIDRCDLQNILYTKYMLDALKLRLNKLEMKMKYKGEAMMGKDNTDNVEAIRRAKESPMQDVLEQFGKTVKFNRCSCPVHDGKNNSSFAIKNNWGFCHSCGWKGDVIDLYMVLYRVSFVEAVKGLQG